MTDAVRAYSGCRRRRWNSHCAQSGADACRIRGARHRNGRRALAMGRRQATGICHTDVVMPDDNAFDLLPRIKRMRPDLPIIVMSAQNTFMTAIKASERGAYGLSPNRSICGSWWPLSDGRWLSLGGARRSRTRGSRPRRCQSSAARRPCRISSRPRAADAGRTSPS